MKRLLFILTIAMAAVGSLHSAQISESAARQVADRFLSSNPARLTAQSGQTPTRLVYTAEHERFYVFDRGVNGGFVVVAGDDRLPQVLGYGASGDFLGDNLPPALRYWMDKTKGPEAEDRVLTVPDAQMQNFMRVASTEGDNLIYLQYNEQFLDKPGKRVRITQGDFTDCTGTIRRIKKRQCVVVQIDHVAALALAFVPPTWLEEIKQ